MEKIILITLVFAACYFVVFGYEQIKKKLIKKDVEENYDENIFIFQIVALRKAFNDNEYYYKTGRIDLKQYAKNIERIGKLVSELEVKHNIYTGIVNGD